MMKISRTAVEGLKKWIKFVHKVMMLIVIYFCSKKPCISAAFDFYENVGNRMIEEDEKVVDRMRMLEELEGGDDENVVDRVRMIEKLGKGDDRISGLPDDILISIISGLTLPEATATSILSSRWRYLHTQLDRVVLPPTSDSTPSRKNLSKYVRMISGAMDSHKSGLVLKEFRICLNRYRGKVYALRCLQFALARRAEIIDINMDSPLHILYIQRYTLRFSNLVRRSTGGHQSLAGLRELSLSGVSWGDEDGIEYLLSNAPLLERLSLSCYRRLKNFSITGNPRLKLTHLQISEACYLESIQIAHLNYLVSFKCYRLASNALTLNNVPNLTELGASEHEHMVPLGYILGRVPCCVLDQLQTFKLWTYRRRIWEPVPRLLNIKYLEVEFSMHYDVNETRSLFSLIEACTSLEEIEIKFFQKDMAFRERRIFFSSPSTKLSPNIKKMKLSGYIGRSVESEVALFVVKNVAAFQELVIQLCDDQTPKIRRRASRCAHKYFRRITILDSVNLLIL